MIIANKNRFLALIFILFSLCLINSQEEKSEQNDKRLYKEIDFLELRGSNTIDAAIGTAILLGDYPDSQADIYLRIGFKHHITSNFNVGLSYNKYNLTIDDTFNQGYMSFDLNLEYMINPDYEFTPFIFGGYGYNASNHFESTQTKVQAGAGIEFIVVEGLGVKLFGEYNQVFSNEMEGLILPDSDESFVRAGLGINLYFGGEKRKEQLLKMIDTVINSNLIK